MTISRRPFPKRLTKIDELTKADHSYLDQNDCCFFLGEYTARKGFAFSDTNRLIINFKKSVERKDTGEWRYRNAAIKEAAEAFRVALDHSVYSDAVFVPVPPSKAKDDILYNDRLLRLLESIKPDINIRELVTQTCSTPAFHQSSERLRPEELVQLYSLNEELVTPEPSLIAIFDDVISTGCHFKAMQYKLKEKFPLTKIEGFFIARRVPDTDFSDLFGDIRLPGP